MRHSVAESLERICLALGLLGGFLLAWGVPEVLAGPAVQEPQALITSPSVHSVVHGRVQIIGTATQPNFQFYKVEYSLARDRQNWVHVTAVKQTPVVNGVLDVWNTTIVPDGAYCLRLRVVDNTGNYRDHEVFPIVVANAMPSSTPSPTPTITPQFSPTPSLTPKATEPAVLTPIIIVGQPTSTASATAQSSPLPEASPSRTSTPRPTRPIATATSSLTGGGSFSTSGIGRAFLLGASMSASLFAIIGLFYLLRRALE